MLSQLSPEKAISASIPLPNPPEVSLPLPARAEMWVQLCSLSLAGGKGDGALALLKFPQGPSALQFPSSGWASLF